MIYAAEVMEVLPDLPGLRVRFKDLVESGFAQYDFCRVLCPRMSTDGGASAWLPEVGDFGVVGKLDGGFYVWLGALPFLNKNQVDPSPDIAYLRHQSGVSVQVRQNGDMAVVHPSGLSFFVSLSGDALPALQASSAPPAGDSTAPWMKIVHPSGAAIAVDPDGNGTVDGFASIVFQAGDKRFSMQGLFDYLHDTVVPWLKAHTHTSAGSGSPTTVPIQAGSIDAPVDSDCLSPASFKGPQGA